MLNQFNMGLSLVKTKKMKPFLLNLIFLLGVATLSGQENQSFEVIVSTDSLLMDNMLKVTFKLENANGDDFQAPDFMGFRVVSGPNTSHMTSIVNGHVSRTISYSYYLEPLEVGNFYIAPAAIKIDDAYLETMPKEIMVVPNPDGIKQPIEENRRSNLGFFDDWPSFDQRMVPSPPPPTPNTPTPPNKKKKKKKKTVRI